MIGRRLPIYSHRVAEQHCRHYSLFIIHQRSGFIIHYTGPVCATSASGDFEICLDPHKPKAVKKGLDAVNTSLRGCAAYIDVRKVAALLQYPKAFPKALEAVKLDGRRRDALYVMVCATSVIGDFAAYLDPRKPKAVKKGLDAVNTSLRGCAAYIDVHKVCRISAAP